jgi:hypothetical protein
MTIAITVVGKLLRGYLTLWPLLDVRISQEFRSLLSVHFYERRKHSS